MNLEFSAFARRSGAYAAVRVTGAVEQSSLAAVAIGRWHDVYPAPDAVMTDGRRPRDFALLEVPSNYAMATSDIRRVAAAISEFLR